MSSGPETRSLPSFPLSHGGSIPIVAYGLGTASKCQAAWRTIGYDTCLGALTMAGFSHLDGAEAYGNEEELGISIKESGIPRSQLFVTTKVHKSISSPKKALSTSLEKLGTDYVDLYLIHAPFWDEKEKGITIEAAWKEMEEIHSEGRAKAIGVSNFSITELQRVAHVAKIQPAANQIEYHP
ncbi:hypothetical protein AA313_de0200013 [Arthrobotrys entomopaga]|nr:hypothetical protein AA313_de0200013 [Arthrobotrys entomopaga]